MRAIVMIRMRKFFGYQMRTPPQARCAINVWKMRSKFGMIEAWRFDVVRAGPMMMHRDPLIVRQVPCLILGLQIIEHNITIIQPHDEHEVILVRIGFDDG